MFKIESVFDTKLYIRILDRNHGDDGGRQRAHGRNGAQLVQNQDGQRESHLHFADPETAPFYAIDHAGLLRGVALFRQHARIGALHHQQNRQDLRVISERKWLPVWGATYFS